MAQRNSLETLLGIELPVIQAPMAGVQGSDMALAVSSAGGLGSLPCAMLQPEELRTELAHLRSQTDRPVNVNFFCHTPPHQDRERERAWREALAPYYREYQIDEEMIPSGPGREPFRTELADILEEFKPLVISFHFGLPHADLLKRVKSWGTRVLSTATTVEEAKWLKAHGADAIIAQGLEAGGHRGMFLRDDLTDQAGTFDLLPQVLEAVDCPVIAAGGIANAEGVRRALALGASGVQVGTAYLLCPEATTREVHRDALKSDAAHHTELTNLFSGGLARGIVNRLMREMGPVSPLAPPFPLAASAVAPLRARAEAEGVADFSPLWCGQDPSGCREIRAAEMTRILAGTA